MESDSPLQAVDLQPFFDAFYDAEEPERGVEAEEEPPESSSLSSSRLLPDPAIATTAANAAGGAAAAARPAAVVPHNQHTINNNNNNHNNNNNNNPHVRVAAASILRIGGRPPPPPPPRVTLDWPHANNHNNNNNDPSANNYPNRGGPRRVFRIPHGSRVTIRHRTTMTNDSDAATRIVPQIHNWLPTNGTAAPPPDGGGGPPQPPVAFLGFRRLPVDGLVPQPLPDHGQIKHREAGPPQPMSHSRSSDDDDSNDDDSNDDEELDDMECVICYDTLIRPVGCGHCPARFCQPCLLHALQRQNPQCPVCRHTVSRSTTTRTIDHNHHQVMDNYAITVDTALQRRLARYGVLCQYCAPETHDDEDKLQQRQQQQQQRLHRLGVHRIPHVDCPDVRYECRLAPYGCTWRGPRRDYPVHQTIDCPYEKVTGLLEQFRQYQIHTETHLQRLYLTVAAATATATQQQQQQQRPIPSPTTTIMPRAVFPDLPQFVALLCTNPGRLQTDVSSWSSFIDARQNLEAALTCLPTALLQIKLFTTTTMTTTLADDDGSSHHGISWSLFLVSMENLAFFAVLVALIGIFPSAGSGWRPIRVNLRGHTTIIGNRHWSVILAVTAFFSQWGALQTTTQQSTTTTTTTRLWLRIVATTMSTCFFPSALAMAAYWLFRTVPRTVTDTRPSLLFTTPQSRATVPLRSALVVVLVRRIVPSATLLSLCDGMLVTIFLFLPLLKRLGMIQFEPFWRDPVLSMTERTVSVADQILFCAVRPVVTVMWNETWVAAWHEVVSALALTGTWVAVHAVVVTLAWLGGKWGPAIVGWNQHARSPMGLVVLCGWLLSLYLLIIL